MGTSLVTKTPRKRPIFNTHETKAEEIVSHGLIEKRTVSLKYAKIVRLEYRLTSQEARWPRHKAKYLYAINARQKSCTSAQEERRTTCHLKNLKTDWHNDGMDVKRYVFLDILLERWYNLLCHLFSVENVERAVWLLYSLSDIENYLLSTKTTLGTISVLKKQLYNEHIHENL